MRELESGIKRLAIYMIYDKDGIIDDYIPYYLNDLSENVSHFVIVCNGKLTDEGREKLTRFTDDIYVRPNIGFDAGAYKDVLLNYLGWDKVYEYDELLLANDTVFGPLFPFKCVFDEMDKRKVDFWGLTEGVKSKNIFTKFKEEFVPDHIQSFFINFSPDVLKSGCFKMFWENYQNQDTTAKTVEAFELSISQDLLAEGYKYAVYENTALTKERFDPLYYNTYLFVNYLNSPVIKKISCNHQIKQTTFYGSEKHYKLLEYIKKETYYDFNAAWGTILRNGDITRIKDNLRLNYAFSADTAVQSGVKLDFAVAIIQMSAYTDYYLSGLMLLPPDLRVFILIDKPDIHKLLSDKLKAVRNIQVTLIDTKKNGMSKYDDILNIVYEYEYLCYIELPWRGTQTELIADFNISWENTLASEAYIKNVVNCFEENQKLGYLAAPLPYHRTRFSERGFDWGRDYDAVKEIALKLGFGGKIEKTYRSFPVSDAFWCRVAAVKPVFESIRADNTAAHIIKKILPYAAQKQGLYSSTLMTTEFSAARNVDLEGMLAGIIRKYNANGELKAYKDTTLDREALLCFSLKHPVVYIYGAGEYADKCAAVLEKNNVDFAGFVVSDAPTHNYVKVSKHIFAAKRYPMRIAVQYFCHKTEGAAGAAYQIFAMRH